MGGILTLRLACASDLPALSSLFRQTVLVNAPQHYTLEQTEVWAASALKTDSFRQFILSVTTFVAINDTGIVGFAGVGEDGHVASVYVRYDCTRQGVGTRLMQAVMDFSETHAMQRLYSEASEFSLGLFQKFGFHLDDTEVVDRQGIACKRYLVELIL